MFKDYLYFLFNSINLNAMLTMANEFNIKYGLSDHSIGITAPIIAASMGASIIENEVKM